MKNKLFYTILLILVQTTLLAVTKTYVGPTDGNWNTAANWSPSGIPTVSDDVIIPAGKNVTISATSFANSISISGSLKINDGIRLDVTTDFTVNTGGSFDMLSENGAGAIATLVVYGNYINNGSTNFWKGTVIIVGNLSSPSSSNIQNNGNVVVGGNIIGAFSTTGGDGSNQIYAVNPNAIVTITPTSIDNNVIPGTQVSSESTTLINLVNSIIFGGSCPFESSTANVSACSGSNAIFTATTNASSPTYQWQVNSNNGSGWVTLSNNTIYSGVTTANLMINNVTVAMNNYKYRAQVTSASCSEYGNYGVLTFVTNTWNGATWSTGSSPTSMENIVINGNYTATSNLTGCSLTIISGNVIMKSPYALTLTNAITVNGGGLTIESGASLVQTNNSAVNTGNITIQRLTTVRKTDYVYWSSPVANFSAAAISPNTSTNLIWKWNPTITNSNGSQGNWVNGNEVMSLGKGYIVRGPNSYSSTPTAFTANFIGVPNNGILQTSIDRGISTITNDDNWNLVGNPYPSSIDALDFLTLNNSKVVGNIRLWTHGTEISAQSANAFYQNYAYNYSATDYINYNGTGSTPPGFSGKIGSGQAFFVMMDDDAGFTNTVTFNNSLRSNTYSNTQFYRSNTSTSTVINETEKSRIWISLVNATNVATTTLIGYVEGATLGEDYLFDAMHKAGTTAAIFSMIGNKSMIIQGRPAQFDTADTIPLGITIPSAGNYTIAISAVDGLFENTTQDIYLEDTFLGTVHNLRNAPYTFSATTGTLTNRFILRYTNATLDVVSNTTNDTFAFVSNNQLQVQSADAIKGIIIYDITGKLVKTYQPDELKNNFTTDFNFSNGVYVAKIMLENGSIINAKLLQ